MKVLITGANGFLGSWLTRGLLDEGLDIKILRRETSDLSELEGLEIEHCLGDINDQDSIEKALEQVDTVFHLAGLIAYKRSQRHLMEKVNVEGTRTLLAAMKNKKCKKLIHMSSVVAIGASFDGTPLTEESEYNIKHLDLGYFETKKHAEELVKEATSKNEIESVILNPSTIYGPGDAKKGSRKTQLKVAKGQFPFYTSGGVNIVAVEDAVAATITAWKRGRNGERYILAGENISIKQLFETIAEKAGSKPPNFRLPNFVLHSLGKIGDGLEAFGKSGPVSSENAWTATLFHWFDSSKAQKELGLQVTPAAQAIEQSVRWSQEHGLI